jgi:hypothetical protein
MEKRTNAGQSAMYRGAYRYFHGEWNCDDISAEIKWFLTYFCNTEIYEDVVDEITDWYNWKGIKYLLFEYETHLAAGANVHLDWKAFQKKDKKDTIEHILPQTPNNTYWRKKWKKKDIDKVTHDIGNLVVTLDNSSYGNKGFDDKKGAPGAGKCYANSALFSERELSQFEEWTLKEFEVRREKLSTWMKSRWFIEDSFSEDHTLDDDDDSDME